MVQVKNKDVVKALFEGGRLEIQDTPSELGKTIVPVIDGTPDFHRVCNFIAQNNRITTGNLSITPPTTKDFYLQSVSLSMIKDATCDVTIGNLLVQIALNGVATYPLSIAVLTLTAQSTSMVLSLAKPIKIDMGTSIVTSIGAYSVGLMSQSMAITGWSVDPN